MSVQDLLEGHTHGKSFGIVDVFVVIDSGRCPPVPRQPRLEWFGGLPVYALWGQVIGGVAARAASIDSTFVPEHVRAC